MIFNFDTTNRQRPRSHRIVCWELCDLSRPCTMWTSIAFTLGSLYWTVKLCEIINDSNGTINFSLFALVDCCILLSCFVVVIDAIHGKGIEKKTTNPQWNWKSRKYTHIYTEYMTNSRREVERDREKHHSSKNQSPRQTTTELSNGRLFNASKT